MLYSRNKVTVLANGGWVAFMKESRFNEAVAIVFRNFIHDKTVCVKISGG